MTKLEMAALALANEVESNIKSGVPLTSTLILALNEFRKTQVALDQSFGADLDQMYRQHIESEMARVQAAIDKTSEQCPVVHIAKARRSKIKPVQ